MQTQVPGSANPLTGMLLAGNGLTSTNDITECIGGWQQLDENNPSRNYQTQCDPRLSGIQTIGCTTVATEELAKQPDWATTTAGQIAPRSATQPAHIEEDELANLRR